MAGQKRALITWHSICNGINPELYMSFTLTIDGSVTESKADERLVDLINRVGGKLPQVCYHPQLGPIQSCDTCMVEVDGKLVRACGTRVASGMTVFTRSQSS